MHRPIFFRCASFALTLVLGAAAAHGAPGSLSARQNTLYADAFDSHWERLNEEYPYLELYGIDWDAERREHRLKALAGKSPTEFACELARLLTVMPDAHVSFVPAIETIAGKWSYPDLETCMVDRRHYVPEWPKGTAPEIPAALQSDPFAYPEIIEIGGQKAVGCAQILAAGPPRYLAQDPVALARW